MQKKCIRILRNIVICIMVIALSNAGAMAASISVKINAATKVYQKASTSARSIKVKKGLKVTLKSYSGSWGKIKYKGKTAYIPLKYLNRTNPVKAYAKNKTTLYKSASTSKALQSVSKGTAVYVLGVDGSYTRVQNKSGSVVGYIKTSDISSKKPSTSSSSSSSSKKPTMPSSVKSSTSSKGSTTSSKIEYLVYVAQKQLGKPYSTNSKPTKSFDCATFTHYCYGKIKRGLVEDSAKTQGYDDSHKKIAYSSLKRGDMVCFNTNSSDGDKSDHVGIYLGKGYFIHASSSAKQVIVSTMSSGYYRDVFSWGRRVL